MESGQVLEECVGQKYDSGLYRNSSLEMSMPQWPERLDPGWVSVLISSLQGIFCSGHMLPRYSGTSALAGPSALLFPVCLCHRLLLCLHDFTQMSPSFFFFFFFPSFLGLPLWHMEVHLAEAASYTLATAAPDLSHSCDLCNSLQQHQILNPLNGARD